MTVRSIRVERTDDTSVLRAALGREPVSAGYLLGDLAPRYFRHGRWFVAWWGEEAVAVVLVFERFETPAILVHGAPDGVAAILDERRAELPGYGYAKVPLAHRAAFERRWQLEDVVPSWVMGLDLSQRPERPLPAGVRRMAEDDLVALAGLFESYPDNYFEPSQLSNGLYVGRVVDGRLLAVAGTHVFAPAEQVAVVGDAVTATSARRRGHGCATIDGLLTLLAREGVRHAALQVAEHNAPAIGLYRNLGFRFRESLLQVHLTPPGR